MQPQQKSQPQLRNFNDWVALSSPELGYESWHLCVPAQSLDVGMGDMAVDTWRSVFFKGDIKGTSGMSSRRRQWQPTPVFLPAESQGRGSLVGCRLWGHTESDTTEAT